jgi:hypothetical protein
MEMSTNDAPHPSQVGRYLLLERVGAGGMGVVYRGHDPLLDRAVAVKLPFFHGPPEELTKQVQRFQREARAAAAVHHPHVCPVYDVGEHSGQPYVVMAFLPGPTLAQRLSAGRIEDVGEAVGIARQLLDGLAAVHRLGVVHRDLKPGNVLFDAAGQAVVTDFGLARPEQAEPLTSANAVLGTPSYMAPEQAAGQLDKVGPWTDLYALGVILYQMVTGRLPFEGPAVAVLPRIVSDEPVPPRRFRPDLDPALESAILRAMRKEPAERYRDAPEFAAVLGSTQVRPTAVSAKGSSPSEDPTFLLAASPKMQRRWTPSRIIGWAIGSVFLLIPSGFLAFLVRVWLHASAEGTDIRVLQVIGFLMITVLAILVGTLGVLIWGLVEATRVREGLLFFARSGEVGWARRALTRGVPVNACNDLGETPLLRAAANGRTEVVKLLLLNGADPAITDRLGQTPLEAARAKGHADIADLLRRYIESSSQTQKDAASVWRPDARCWLLAVVTAGAVISIALNYLCADRRQITTEQFLQLSEKKLVKEATYRDPTLLFGEVRDSVQPEVRRLDLVGRRFWVRVPEGGFPKVVNWRLPNDPIIIHAGGVNLPLDCWTSSWIVVPMFAWPVGVLSLVFLPLIGVNAFPFLALRGKVRGR